MKLIELKGHLERIVQEHVDPNVFIDGIRHTGGVRTTFPYVNTIGEAQLVSYLCPKCFKDNNGPIGTHGLMTPFANKGVPDNIFGGMARWDVSGHDIQDITVSPSILVIGGCNAHFFIRNGEIQFA